MLAALFGAVITMQSPSVGYSFGPEPSRDNPNYVTNRAPLLANPFIELPVGTVKPRGWVKEVLNRQRTGLNGNLGEISAWLQEKDNAWLSKDGKGAWGWEEVPYWLKGYGEMGYVLGDEKVIAETKRWLESAIASQTEDGNFGPVSTDDRNVEDFWPKMIMLYCFESCYEYSGDVRVVDLMTKFFRYQLDYPDDKFMQMYWQSRRTGDNLHSVLWLYNITGDQWLLDLARKIYHRGLDWTPKSGPEADWYGSMPDWHNVNIAQGFRQSAEFYQLSGLEKDKAASYDAFHTVREYFGQVPGGMFGADENARKGYSDPRQAVETCGLVEQVNSDQEMFRITGDRFWGDHIEDVVFNTLPAAYMPDMRSLRYLTAPNMVLSDDKNHSPGIQNSGPFLLMNPFSSRCCQHNHGMGWPYLVKNLIMATADKGVVATVYAPFEANVKVGDGVEVRLGLETHYPFTDSLLFTIDPTKSVEFPLYLRVPAWCKAPEIRLNGKKAELGGLVGPYIKIDRVWKRGDQIEMRLPMDVSVRKWEANKDSVSVDYGPLTFSLKIDEEYVQVDSTSSAVGDSKWQDGADPSKWPSFMIRPKSDWNFGLLAGAKFTVKQGAWPKDNYPFTVQSVPLTITTQGKQISSWKLDEFGLCGLLPQSPVETATPVQELTLIPMGAARLRISAFPTVK
jgi:hypothetical protein